MLRRNRICRICLAIGLFSVPLVLLPCSTVRADQLIIVRSGNHLSGRAASIDDPSAGNHSIDPNGALRGEPCTTPEDCTPLEQVHLDACYVRTCYEGACDIESTCTAIETCDGAGSCDQVVFFDEFLTYLPGPELAPFATKFTQADFDAARAGPAPRLGMGTYDGCYIFLHEDVDAEFVWTDASVLSRPSTSALFAIDFEITDPSILAASLDLYIRANDLVGGGPDDGVFINGTPLSGDTSGGTCLTADAFNIYRDDIAPLLHIGINTLYLNVTHSGSSSGVLFTAEIRVDTDGPHQVRVDDDAAPGGDGTSWNTAFDSLQLALETVEASADPNREIWLTSGTYTPTKREDPTDPRSVSFRLLKDVDILGGFSGTEQARDDRVDGTPATIISGDINGDDVFLPTHPTWNENAYHLFSGDRLARRVNINDLTMTHGKANGLGSSEDKGSAIYQPTNGDLTLYQCSVDDNYSETAGTIYLGVRGSLNMSSSTASGNVSAGRGFISAEFESSVELSDCQFFGNLAAIGGVVSLRTGSSLVAVDCLFADSVDGTWGGAIEAQTYIDSNVDNAGIDLTLTRCDFLRNQTRGDGGAINYVVTGAGHVGSLTVTDCLFDQNTTRIGGDGGAIRATNNNTSDIPIRITGSTFSNSLAVGSGGALYFHHFSSTEVSNCNFTNNLAKDDGSAVSVLSQDSSFRDCSFVDNRSSTGDGALSVKFSDYTELTRCSFIRNEGQDYGGALLIGGFSLAADITDCIFVANICEDGRGGAIYTSVPDINIVNSLFAGNSAKLKGGAINAIDSFLTMTNSTVYGNSTLSDDSGGLYGSNSYFVINNSIIRANTDLSGGGLEGQLDGDATTAADFNYSNIEGVTLSDGNIDVEPVFVDLQGADGTIGTEDDDLRLASGSPGIDAGNNNLVPVDTVGDLDELPRFHDDTGTPDTGNGTPPIVDMGCYEFQERTTRLYHVDRIAAPGGDGASWTEAIDDLQVALAISGEGDVIIVAQGTYLPVNPARGVVDRNAAFQLVDGVTLFGGYAGLGTADPDERDIELYETILSGDIGIENDDSDNSYHVVVGSATGASTELNGFTITQGNGDGASSATRRGAGLYIDDGLPSIHNCLFADNHVTSDGGGVFITNGAPLFSNCSFVYNTAGQSGGGMANITDASPHLLGCRFLGNQSYTGGGALHNETRSHSVIRNSLFVGNVTNGNGGGINSVFSKPVLTNCVVAQNLSGGAGGGLAYEQSTILFMANTIVWGNVDSDDGITTNQIYISGATLLPVANCVQDFSYAGTAGNISEDPLFIRSPDDGGDDWGNLNDDFGDLHLRPGSPCIDAGSNVLLPESIIDDLDGNPRFHDDPTTIDTGVGTAPIVDMGAFEFRPADCDNVGTVDLSDLAELSPCMTGPEAPVSAECRCFDLFSDDRVDLKDVALFQILFNQP